MGNMYKVVEKWLDGILEQIIPEEVVALNSILKKYQGVGIGIEIVEFCLLNRQV